MKRNVRKRHYRAVCRPLGMVAFDVRIEESDLRILADTDLSREAAGELRLHRALLKAWLEENPAFYTSFSPLAAPDGPEIARLMADASFLTDTGPMASVAGATAELVGRRLLRLSSGVVVENGGDIFMCARAETTVAIYAGESPFSMRIGLSIPGDGTARGVATSSGTVGHSYSAGGADAVTVVCRSAAAADGAATRLANVVRAPGDLRRLPGEAARYPFIEGGVAVFGKEMTAWGNVSLVTL